MKFSKFPSYKQFDAKDCGPTCLQIIAQHYGKFFNLDTLRELCGVQAEGVSIYNLCKVAESIGFKTLPVLTSYKQLQEEIPLPCIVHWRKRHYIVVYKVTKEKVWVSDPQIGLITYTKHEFVNGWLAHLREPASWRKGKLIAMEPTDGFIKTEKIKNNHQKNDFTHFIIRFLKALKIQSITLLLLTLFLTALQSFIPFIIKQITDTSIAAKDYSFINILVAIYAILGICTSLGIYWKSDLNSRIALSIKTSMLSDTIVRILRLPYSFFETKSSADIKRRINDFETIENFVRVSAFNIFSSVFALISLSTILIIFQLQLFCIFLIGNIVSAVWIAKFWNTKKKIKYQYYGLESVSYSHLNEMVLNIQDIKINNYEENKRWNWEKIQLKLLKMSTKLSKMEHLETLGLNIINNLRDIAIISFSAYLALNSNLTIGTLVAAHFLIWQLKIPLDGILKFIQSYQLSQLSYQRTKEIGRVTPELISSVSSALPEDNSIILQNVNFRFANRADYTLKDISLAVPKGKITAIVGYSGSGKSTLVKILLGLYRPTTGSLLIGGLDSDVVDLNTWRSKIGVITQETKLFKDSILNNIILGNNYEKEKLLKSLEIANLNLDLNRMPSGYNTLVGENGKGLSEGQKQKIHIARAVYKNPEFWFLDEATNNLDSKSEKIMMDGLMSELRHKTAIIVAHRLGTIINADHIVVIDGGRIVATGSHQQLIMNQDGVYYDLFKHQLIHQDI